MTSQRQDAAYNHEETLTTYTQNCCLRVSLYKYSYNTRTHNFGPRILIPLEAMCASLKLIFPATLCTLFVCRFNTAVRYLTGIQYPVRYLSAINKVRCRCNFFSCSGLFSSY